MRLEPKAPPLLRSRAAAVFAAPGILLPILALLVVFLSLLGRPQPLSRSPMPLRRRPRSPRTRLRRRRMPRRHSSRRLPRRCRSPPRRPQSLKQPATPAATPPPRPAAGEPEAEG